MNNKEIRVEILKSSNGYCVAINDHRIAGGKLHYPNSVIDSWLIDADALKSSLIGTVYDPKTIPQTL